MKKILKYLSYSLLYLVVSLASAYGVINLSMYNASVQTNQGGNAESTIPAQINKIVENISSEDYINLNLNAFIENGEQTIDIVVNGGIDISNGFSNIKANGDISVKLDEQKIDLTISYQNGNLFVEAFNNKFVINTSNLMSSVTTLLELLNIDLNLGGLDLNSLDLNSILGLFSNIEEIKNDDKTITLNIALPVVGNLSILCDENYNVLSLSLPKASISDNMSLEISGDLQYPEEILVDEKLPQDYINITTLLDYSDDLINLLNKQTLGFKTTIKYNSQDFVADLFIDTSTFDFALNSEILDTKLNLFMLDNIIYIEFGNIYAKYSIDDLPLLNNLLAKFNIDFDLNMIVDIVSNIKDGNLNNIMASLGIESSGFDLTSLDLSLLEKLDIVDDKLLIEIKDIGTISIYSVENEIQSLEFNGFGIEAKLETIEYKEIALNYGQDYYVNLAKLVPTIENMLELVDNNRFEGTLNLTINDFSFDFDYLILINEGNIYAQLATTIYGQNVTIKYLDNMIYLDIVNAQNSTQTIKLYVNVNEIDKIIQSISSTFNLDLSLGEIENLDMLETIKNILSSETAVKLISSITEIENGISINALNGIVVNITNINNQNNIEISYQNINVKANIFASNEEISIPTITTTDYVNVETLLPIVEQVYNIYQNKEIFVEFSGNYQDLSLNGAINYYNNSLELTASLSYKGLTAIVMLYQNKIYVQVENIKLAFGLDDKDTLFAFLNEYFGINVEQTLNELLGKVETTENTTENEETTTETFDINTILNDILPLISLGLDSDSISISYDSKLNAIINYYNGKITTLSIGYQDINSSLTLSDSAYVFAPTGEYVEIVELLDYIKPFMSYIETKQLAFNLNMKYNETNIEADIFVNLTTFNLAINANIIDTNLNIFMIDNVVYLEFGNIYARYSINDLPLVNNLLAKFNIDFDLKKVVEIINSLKNNEFDKLLTTLDFNLNEFDIANLDLSIIKQFKISNNVLTIEIDSIGVIAIEVVDSNLQNINFNGFGVNVSLTPIEYKEIALNYGQDYYVNLAKLVPTIENMLELVDNNRFEGTLNLTINDFSFDFDYLILINEGNIYAQLATTIYGQNVTIKYLDNMIYLDIVNAQNSTQTIKLYVNVNEIDKIIQSISSTFNLDLSLGEIENLDMLETIKNILSSETAVKLISSITEIENGISINALNGIVVNITNINNQNNIEISYQNINVKANIFASNEEISIPTITTTDYVNVETLLPIVEQVYNIYQNKEIFVEFSGNYQDLSLNGAINYYNNSLELTASLSYKGLTAIVMLYQNKIYVQVENIKLAFGLDDKDTLFAFLNEYFGINVEQTLNELLGKVETTENTTENEETTTETFDINTILNDILPLISLGLDSDSISISYDSKLNAIINYYNGKITTLSIGYQDINSSLTLSDSAYVFAPTGEYVEIVELLDYVKLFMNYIETKQLEFNAIVTVLGTNNSTINASVQADFTSMLKLGAKLSSETLDNFDISVYVQDGMLYFNYNGLLLKINNDHFNELLYIVLEFVGVDPTTIPFLSEIDLDLDLSQFQVSTPEIKIEDIINIVQMIKDFNLTSTSLNITLDGKALYNNEKAEDIVISLSKKGGKLEKLTANNVYLDNELSQAINIDISFDEWSGYKGADTSLNYVDISGSNELIKAFLNMINTKDFHIKGTVNITGELLGINITKFFADPVNVDVYVKVLENNEVEIYGSIGVIPTMIEINNDVPYKAGDTESGSDRYLYFYYKDGYIYLYRTEYVDIMFGASKRQYEKCVKIALETFFADPMQYVQYSLGFTDTIMDAIETAMAKSLNRTSPINYGNIIKSFSIENDVKYSLLLNMAEIANNTDLDSLQVDIGLSKDASNKNYIANLGFNIFMPLSEDVFELTLDSDDLTLVDYGKEVDMNPLYDFINNYQYDEGAYYEASNGNWSLASQTLYTIYFEENGGSEVNNITAIPNSDISLPSYQNIVTDDGKTKTTKIFLGWFTTETFEENTQFTSNKMPRQDITLYAKWGENIEYYYTIKFVTNSTDNFADITKLEGDSITLPLLTTKEVSDEYSTTYYSFGGWYSTENYEEGTEFNLNVMPSYNLTLYAKWDFVKVERTYTVNVYDNNTLISSLRVKAGDLIDLSNTGKVNDTTKFYHDSSYTQELETLVMPEQNVDIHIRNQYTVIFTSQYGDTETISHSYYQGETIEVPSQNSYVYDDGTQTVQTTYTFKGYDLQSTIMPNSNVTYTAIWNVTNKYYYTITFDILDNDVSLNASPWKNNAKLYYNGVETSTLSYRFLEGDVDLSPFVARCKYTTGGGIFTVYWYYIFQGWKGADENNHYNLTGDVTIEASFSSLKRGESGYNQN